MNKVTQSIYKKKVDELEKQSGNADKLESIVDNNGNKRFVEGDGTYESISGVTINYCKWSLSGTHFMCVVSGTINSGTIVNYPVLANYTIPSYVYSKIITITSNIIEIKTLSAYSSSAAAVEMEARFRKNDNNSLDIYVPGQYTITGNNRTFRLQFDLLIDAE